MSITLSPRNQVAAKLYDFYNKTLKQSTTTKQKARNSELFRSVFNIESSKPRHLNMFLRNIERLTNEVDCSEYTLRRSGPSDETEEQRLKRQRQDGANKIKGDLFEIYTYVYLQLFGAVSGVFDCEFASYDQIGYDFIGVNHAKNPCVVQSKFVGNFNTVFGADESGNRIGSLETFFSNLPEGFVIKSKQTSRVLVTTARKIHSYYTSLARTDKTFEIHDFKKLAKRTNNDGFWAVVSRYSSSFFQPLQS